MKKKFKKNDLIRFSNPYYTGNEKFYIDKVLENATLSGDGELTKLCNEELSRFLNVKNILLTNSCTAALEMAALLLDIQPQDEVIMPSYTFVSTANAFVIRGGIPVFIDIDKNTLNLDLDFIEKAITSKTKAIVAVHYGGISCDMNRLCKIAKKYGIPIIEDSAQALGGFYEDKPLGTIGSIGCFSFHATKNIISGEGGAIYVKDENLFRKAEIIREKGTNRTAFSQGFVDKYTWIDVGSSFLPSELMAGFLYPQLLEIKEITNKRLKIWEKYKIALVELEKLNLIEIPQLPNYSKSNAHLFYILLKNEFVRNQFIAFMRSKNIITPFHYVPLHNSSFGAKVSKVSGDLFQTDRIASTLVRLPLWPHMPDIFTERIIEEIKSFFNIS